MSGQTSSHANCPMCGQPLQDPGAARRAAVYEGRLTARLEKSLQPELQAQMEAKYRQVIVRAEREADDLKRALDAKTQRALMDEQQDALQARLERAFPDDEIDLVGNKGAGDILQTVRTADGKEIGRILLECKNTKEWDSGWVGKTRRDGQVRRATHLIIASRRLPSGASGFCEIDGVLVSQPDYTLPLIHVLRMWMIATHGDDKDTPDIDTLWAYLSSDVFKTHLKTLRTAATQDDNALVAEERAHRRWWSERAKRAGAIRSAIAGIDGDIREIAERSPNPPHRLRRIA